MNKFNTSFKGYDKTEVDKFIDEVTMRYSNLLNALKVKEQELKETKEKLGYFDNLVDSLNKAMMAAEETSANIKKMAREESNQVIQTAKNNASRIINEALLKAEQAELEADAIKRKVAAYKRKIKAIVNEQLEYLDDIDKVEID